MTKPRRLLSALAPLLVVATAGAQGASPSSTTDTLFLTWSEDPTTTMTIQWLTPGVIPPLAESRGLAAGAALPRLEGVAIDGRVDDWASQGHAARLLADAYGRTTDPADLAATATMGWDDRGVLLNIDVVDDEARESAKDDALWDTDSAELFVMRADGSRAWQLVVAPGVDPAQPQLRTRAYDRADLEGQRTLAPEVASARTERGYRIEARLPWEALAMDAATLGDEAAAVRLQVYVNDRDLKGGRDTLGWYPSSTTAIRPLDSRMLSLGRTAGATSETVRGQLWRREGGPTMTLLAEPGLAGKEALVQADGRTLGSATFRAEDGRAVAELPVLAPEAGRRWGDLAVLVNDQQVGVVPDTPDAWAEHLPPAKLRYGLPAGAAQERAIVESRAHAFGHSSMSVQRVKLQGLEPGTDYVFEIDGDATTYRFRTAPKVLDRPLVFAEGGDIAASDVVATLHDMAASWDPLFGLVGGDLAYSDGRNLDRELDFYRMWSQRMRTKDGRLIPMIAAIGNHEVDGSFGQPRERAPFFFALFGDLYPEKSYATLDFGDYLSIITLDTDHISPIVGEQTRWLERVLEERLGKPDAPRTAPPHVFTAYHVPGYPSVRRFEDTQSVLVRENWVPLFERYGLKVSFEHHDHSFKRTHPLLGSQPTTDPKGVVYLGDGCWGRTPRPVHPDSPYLAKTLSAYHVFKVTLDGQAALFEPYNERNEKLDEHRY